MLGRVDNAASAATAVQGGTNGTGSGVVGEVTNPGQYPYVPNMTAETAIAIAGGFAPRAQKGKVEISRNLPGQQFKGDVPTSFALKPGDTIVVKERWF